MEFKFILPEGLTEKYDFLTKPTKDWRIAVFNVIKTNIIAKNKAGKNPDGSEREEYSTKPVTMYARGASIQKKSGVMKPYKPPAPMGKRGKLVKRGGGKTRRFEGGYREYKQETFGTDTVTLENTGRTFDNIKMKKDGNNAVKIFIGQPVDAKVGAWNQAKRRWFGIGTAIMDVLNIVRVELRERGRQSALRKGRKKV